MYPLASRPIGHRLRHLRTPGDFRALAEGGTALGIDQVKFISDMDAGGVTHFLSAARWDLHYTFVRELIEGLPTLNRCDPDENQIFRAGWVEFSNQNYSSTGRRRYDLGTLVHYGANDTRTLEFSGTDGLSGEDMKNAFFTVISHTDTPESYGIRPRTTGQLNQLRTVEGEVPLVGRLTPFEDTTFQALTQTVGYGVLTYVPAHALDTTPLGPQVIVITDEVPNDIALTGGLITEHFQTPLAHVNLLSRNRDTPNMALLNARRIPHFSLIGQLVRLEVMGAGFDIRAASSKKPRHSGKPDRLKFVGYTDWTSKTQTRHGCAHH